MKSIGILFSAVAIVACAFFIGSSTAKPGLELAAPEHKQVQRMIAVEEFLEAEYRMFEAVLADSTRSDADKATAEFIGNYVGSKYSSILNSRVAILAAHLVRIGEDPNEFVYDKDGGFEKKEEEVSDEE